MKKKAKAKKYVDIDMSIDRGTVSGNMIEWTETECGRKAGRYTIEIESMVGCVSVKVIASSVDPGLAFAGLRIATFKEVLKRPCDYPFDWVDLSGVMRKANKVLVGAGFYPIKAHGLESGVI